MSDIFISDAHEDHDRAKALADALQRQGWEVWWDRTMSPGMRYREEIAKQLQSAGCVVVLWSREGLQSDFVIDEAEDGKRRGILVQVLLDNVEPPHGFRQINWGNLSKWTDSLAAPEFVEVCAGISRLVVPKKQHSPGMGASTPAFKHVPPKQVSVSDLCVSDLLTFCRSSHTLLQSFCRRVVRR